MTDPLLKVTDLQVQFNTEDGVVRAVNGISFDLAAGETLGIVGESGSGKSVANLSLLGLIPQPPGEIVGGRAEFRGKDLLSSSHAEMTAVRGNDIAMIFQDPMTALNPFLTVEEQLSEVTRLHLGLSSRDALDHAIEMLQRVGIPAPEKRVFDYPHQFSGGMRQRVMIAMALSCNPDVLIADEPTTALDVTIQAQILDLMRDLQERDGTAIILITHDLGVVASICHRVLVMYGGRIVERADVDSLFSHPQHPYTHGLLRS
ncbi:MAG: ABC transporter ATP-binding protein, partial [Pirellulaceae bacterium]|nr:ABC transporter ATP-binding protein [Pirellulaceae bacterium]